MSNLDYNLPEPTKAQLEYARQCQHNEPEQARYWLELAAGQGSQEARRLLRQWFPG